MFANSFFKKSILPGCDVINFLNIQDDEWLVSLSFNISKIKHVIKKLTTDITLTSKVLIDKLKQKYIAISL